MHFFQFLKELPFFKENSQEILWCKRKKNALSSEYDKRIKDFQSDETILLCNQRNAVEQ